MFTGNLNQGTSNSCGAATLVIAAHLNESTVPVNGTEVATVYNITGDLKLSQSLAKPGVTVRADEYLSSPERIIFAAVNRYKLKETLYTDPHIDLSLVSKDPHVIAALEGFKSIYIDALKPQAVETKNVLAKVTGNASLMILVYVNGDPTATHWLLVQSDGAGGFAVYDTAYGKNYDKIITSSLDFNTSFNTGRKNNFYGVSILLTK